MTVSEKLIRTLKESGWLKTPSIIRAFEKIKREDFLSPDSKGLAGLDEALPIGYGQTISQPQVVAFMLELLSPQKGEKILDIGSGSGWTTALLCEIVSPKGRVIGIERIPELAEFGRKNIAKYNFIEKEIGRILCKDGYRGYKKEAPFDKILCSAAIKRTKETIEENLPCAWKEQLKTGGKIVVPIDYSIWLFEKISENHFNKKEYPGFVFVPLVKE